VRHHHERWDGGGYPDELAGAEIPLGARILALADSLDAICSDRPYRRTRGFEDIVEEISQCSGSQFDPQVVRAFLAVAQEKGPKFFKNSAATVDRVISSEGGDQPDPGFRRFLKKSLLQETHK
jgi:HD-GYP domain-containing protein (c-di-GMP phosphodiesterase class II)